MIGNNVNKSTVVLDAARRLGLPVSEAPMRDSFVDLSGWPSVTAQPRDPQEAAADERVMRLLREGAL